VNRTAVDLFGVRVITIRPRVLVCLVDDEMEEPSALSKVRLQRESRGSCGGCILARVGTTPRLPVVTDPTQQHIAKT
jgi:hypothetical protein